MISVPGKGKGKKCSAHLHSLSFLKNEETCDFGPGAVAMHVGMFSGCSIHNLCRTPAASNFSAKFFSCVSPFTSNVTYTNTILEINFCFLFLERRGLQINPAINTNEHIQWPPRQTGLVIKSLEQNGTNAVANDGHDAEYIFVCQSVSQTP